MIDRILRGNMLVKLVNGVFGMADETIKRERGSKDGKYDLIVYLLEMKKTVEEIINMSPKEALELLNPKDEKLMGHLQTYLKRNINKIEKFDKKYFFPGNKGPASRDAVVHELHFHLKKMDPPRSLAEFGLKLRTDRSTNAKEPEKPQDVLSWAKQLLD